jgi:hypothetical protein
LSDNLGRRSPHADALRVATLNQQVANSLGPPYRFGDVAGGNYLEIEADGTLVLYGTATVQDDILMQLIGQKLETTSSHIEQDAAEGSLHFETSCNLNDYVVMNVQLSHTWKLGSAVAPHLHWWQSSATMPNWLIQYRWQKQGGLKTTAWTSQKWSSNAFTYTSGTLNQISLMGSIAAPVGYGQVSDIIQVRVLRDVANGSGLFSGSDALNAIAHAVSFDLHYEKDSLGSHQEYVK